MKFIISNLRTSIDESTEILKSKSAKKLGIKSSDIKKIRIVKESIDSRKKNNITFVYSVLIELDSVLKVSKSNDIKIIEDKKDLLEPGSKKMDSRPVIIGSGPAGLFAGLLLADHGYNPIIIERGDSVEDRSLAVKKHWENGVLDPESNVQFGEGGAGTFSDGKLTTRINDSRCEMVLNVFKECGIPEDVLYKAKPHIGTDKLKEVLVEIRERIIKNGGEIKFRTRADKVIIKDRKLKGILLSSGELVSSNLVILAIGHSARDTFSSLLDSGVNIIQKAFSVGLRIEHPQNLINEIQFGKYAGHPRLGAAEYSLFSRQGNRTAYSFCMCPGGIVVAAASEDKTIVTNGMSEYARNRVNANAAFVVSIKPDDFRSSNPLAGIEFQRKMEKQAFLTAGGTGSAPIQRLKDFLDGVKTSQIGKVSPSYTGETSFSDLNECLPDFIAENLKTAAFSFDNRMKGFLLPDALLTGVETRTSSPVRILRDESFQADGIEGLYPAGEGAGYAGGIMSAAVDGLRIAEEIIQKYQSFE